MWLVLSNDGTISSLGFARNKLFIELEGYVMFGEGLLFYLNFAQRRFPLQRDT